MNLLRKILMIAGALIIIFFLIVDFIGIGDPGFGHRQIIGVASGIILIILVLVLKRKKPV